MYFQYNIYCESQFTFHKIWRMTKLIDLTELCLPFLPTLRDSWSPFFKYSIVENDGEVIKLKRSESFRPVVWPSATNFFCLIPVKAEVNTFSKIEQHGQMGFHLLEALFYSKLYLEYELRNTFYVLSCGVFMFSHKIAPNSFSTNWLENERYWYLINAIFCYFNCTSSFDQGLGLPIRRAIFWKDIIWLLSSD